nr:nucleoside hydrolase [Clostridia bacterium]
MERTKVIIDTDIGDDIDDTLALYLAMQMDFDIIGITTVFGDTEKRARLAKKLMVLHGGKYALVPVYAGEKTDVSSFPTYMCQCTDDLSEIGVESGAVDFIADSCKKYGKNLVILAIGPFTNLAKVIEKDREALNSVGKVVIMGGAYFRQYADWNVMCDTHAAKIMFENLKNLECLGADVTHSLSVGKENSDKLLALSGAPVKEYVSELYGKWLAASGADCAVLHDPLAVYYLKHPDICEMSDISVAVVTDGYAKGLTVNVDAYRKAQMNEAFANFDFSTKAKVAKSVDSVRMVSAFSESI